MMLYGFHRSPKGRRRSEFPLGQIEWDGKLVLKVRDRALRDNLREYFERPVWVPLPLGDVERMMGHTWDCLESGDEEHFLEAVKRLHTRDLFVDLDS